MLFRLLVASVCLSAVFAAPIERDQTTEGPVEFAEGSCGLVLAEQRLNPEKQIETAQPHSWPWMVTLCSTGNESELAPTCADAGYELGTVVGSRWVLTILFDLPQDVMETLRVRTGVHNWLSGPEEEPDSRLYNVSRVHEFPYVRNGTIETPMGDMPWKDPLPVALIELSTDIHFDETVQPVCLAAQDEVTDGWVAGWRRSSAPDTQHTPMDTDMSQLHVGTWFFVPGMTTYMSIEGHNDSYVIGAPLMKQHDDAGLSRWFQYGLLIGDSGEYGAGYERVPYYCEWIEETTGGEVKCQ